MGEKPLAATKKKGSFTAILGCIGIIFLGCCLNNIALEFIISKKRNPYADKNYGTVLTLLQFLFISLVTCPSYLSLKGSRVLGVPLPFSLTSVVPQRKYGTMALIFVVMSILNNLAFSFNISQPMHMVFRCSNLITTYLFGYLYLKKKDYTRVQLLAVVLITLGAAAATMAETSMGDTAVAAAKACVNCGDVGSAAAAAGGGAGGGGASWASALLNSEASGGPIYLLRWWIGIGILVTVLLLQTLLGSIQDVTRREHGEHSGEMLFFFHFFSLPAFVFALPLLPATFASWSNSPSTAHEVALAFGGFAADYNLYFPFILQLPIMWTHVLLNVVSQYVCLMGVYGLIGLADQLTVNVALTVRKFASIILSVLVFKNTFTPTHWLGTILVLGGTFVYGVYGGAAAGAGAGTGAGAAGTSGAVAAGGGSGSSEEGNPDASGTGGGGGGVRKGAVVEGSGAYRRGQGVAYNAAATTTTTTTTTSSSSSSSSSSSTFPVSLLRVEELKTTPIADQKPGTSGLRKKTREFMKGLYLHNFVQATFDALDASKIKGSTMVVSGDGRYWTKDAVQVICKIAAGNGVKRVWVGRGGLLSTPAVSCIIREREGGVSQGGFILTASHNPGGLEEDFGIKYNSANGGPAPESLTDAIFANTKTVSLIRWCPDLPTFDLDTLGATSAANGAFTVEVLDPVEDYAASLARIFDFPKLRALVARPDFSMAYDAMCGVAGPYGKGVLGGLLGVPAASLHNCDPLPDFGGHHPDPNLTYAEELVALCGLTRTGESNPAIPPSQAVPELGAAQDGDADRNMILGKRFFVTPSDSIAIIAANASACIPFFAGGVKGVARSMPTSCALDRVALKAGIPLFEVPTGWKFFGNLMDSGELGKRELNPFLCGEESFGTGSNHVREKDGLWAVLAWMSILAHANASTPIGRFATVESIVRAHWRVYGRNYYCRYDYEGVEKAKADAVMGHLGGLVAGSPAPGAPPTPFPHIPGSGSFLLAKADSFTYNDPVDDSVSKNQGLRFIMTDGSRVVYRLSGTGSVGATIRVYIEKYEADTSRHALPTAEALKELVAIALGLARMEELTGRSEPTVIT